MNIKGVYSCDPCNVLYVCLKYFHEHLKRHATQEGRTIYPCSYCQTVHTSEHESKLHCLIHRNETPHKCEICQEKVETCEQDMIYSHGPLMNDTDFDAYEATSDDDDEHEEYIDEEDEVEQVEREFDEEENQLSDQFKVIVNNTVKSPSPLSRSTGNGKGNRNSRLSFDEDLKSNLSCCHCGKSFKTKSHLQRHILTHTGEKPYHCNQCDGRFNQSSSLRNHVIAKHTKEFPHICNNCKKGFLMPALLKRHLQSSECG